MTTLRTATVLLTVVAGALLATPSAWAADPVAAPAKITFNNDSAPLVLDRCACCHHPGEVAPFSLLSYGDVKKRAQQIAQVTADRFMPPWKSMAGHGRFVGERRLTPDQ